MVMVRPFLSYNISHCSCINFELYIASTSEVPMNVEQGKSSDEEIEITEPYKPVKQRCVQVVDLTSMDDVL